MKRVLTLVLPILFTVFALAACSSGSNDSSSPPDSDQNGDHSMTDMPSTSMPMSAPADADQAAGPEIVVDDYMFTVSGSFTPGETVTLRNNDTVEHSVTSDNGDLFDIEIKPGATATLTVPDQPGSFAFHCRYHPFMMGSFTVQ
ncbi:cupredoxin domain-containing protein [Rhodococcus marinonascens]|uniref:cupredoxin domain-containing protein n=1 Tax=Rhodococcus marinonascens TaxID=38311 RepID=UPI00093343F3|nr:cupredoxin domain-containing protein [Rhodococcus marinonascens]